ncbi:excitatory amino acid transporter 1 isoform x2 [Limosa lapponica baueri]|uniref:Amino acid transporter n=1 Tax=Limosa lapponica baueri TaxID=1758121 RepID=A0A2I0U3P6_LIMLA|nr:excitatory amino acid transporter 1 isoform x2 [Limosa lapponica baueri]
MDKTSEGVILGFSLRSYKMSYREVKYFSFPGELLMRMLQMLVLPLIVSSLVTDVVLVKFFRSYQAENMTIYDGNFNGDMQMFCDPCFTPDTENKQLYAQQKNSISRKGIAALDSKASGKMGIRAVVYYMSTTIIAVLIGIIIVVIIHPGKGTKENMHREGKIVQVTAADAFLDLIRNMFPPNLVEACFKQFKTNYEKRMFKVNIPSNDTSTVASIISNVSEAMEALTRMKEEIVPVPGSVNGVNALGLVVFSISFGLVIGSMREQGQALKDFFDSLNEAIMRLVALIMWYAPLGILFLIAGKIVEMEDMGVIGGQLAMYTVTVIIGLLIHAVIVLPLLYFLITRKNPWVFIGGLIQALVTALGTSSSSATLPVTFKCLEEINGVDKRVTRFVLPVGATINMDGTALYEALAAIFIAQVNNFDLNFGQIITIRDRLRTTTNVLGDSIGAGIVEHLSRHELKNRDAEMGNSVIEENEMKKPYQLISQENESEKPLDSETKM